MVKELGILSGFVFLLITKELTFGLGVLYDSVNHPKKLARENSLEALLIVVYGG